MSAETWAGFALALALLVYLIYTLLRPEQF